MRVHKGGKFEIFSAEVLDGANQIDGIEVSSLFKHGFFLSVVHVDLRTLENLRRVCSVGIVCQERSSAGLSDVAHHATDTDGSVQFLFQIDGEFRVLKHFGFRVLCAEFFLNELQHFAEFVHRVASAVQFFEIGKDFLLDADQDSREQSFVFHRVLFEFVGHDIVDVLHKDDVRFDVVEVFNQCAVSAGSEEERAIFFSEGRVVGVGCHGVCGRFLFGEGDVVGHAEMFFIGWCHLRNEFLEECAVFR